MSNPEHVKSYRYQSWQIEILIAGGILYGLFKSSDILKELFYDFFPISEVTSNKMIFLFGAYIITKILLIGFSANLFLRSVWLGYLGINFWFPNDINYSRVGGSESYKANLKKQPSTQSRLEILERWCNLSFSFAVLLGFFTLSLFISLSAVIWLLDTLPFTNEWTNSALLNYGMAVLILCFQIGLFDRFLLKESKHKKWNSAKQTLLRVFNIVTLSFLFKREFLVLRSNTNAWAFSTFVILYLTIAVVTSINQIGQYYPGGTLDISLIDDRENYDIRNTPKIYSAQYNDNLPMGSHCFYGSIQSEIINDDYVKLFIVSWIDFDNRLASAFETNGLQKNVYYKSEKVRDSMARLNQIAWQQSVNDLFVVTLDNELLSALSWSRYTHPKTAEEGYVAFIDISLLSQGKHILDVDVNRLFNNGVLQQRDWFIVPFWKQSR